MKLERLETVYGYEFINRLRQLRQISYIFNQKKNRKHLLATIFTYTVQYPDVHHRTGLGTAVRKQFRTVHGSLQDTVGNYFCIFSCLPFFSINFFFYLLRVLLA